jgi:hypothetical protein
VALLAELRGNWGDVANNIKAHRRVNLILTFHLSLPLNMARPSRKHSSRLISSLSFVFFLFIALTALCPPAVSADKKPEYGAVIGIGTSFFLFLSSLFFSNMVHL